MSGKKYPTATRYCIECEDVQLHVLIYGEEIAKMQRNWVQCTRCGYYYIEVDRKADWKR